MAGYWDHINESLIFLSGAIFFDQLSDYQILKSDTA
jgi:hypothetical protein